MKNLIADFLLMLAILLICGFVGCCSPTAASHPATQSTTKPAPATQPALPFWFYLELRYPHHNMNDPEVTPRDFEQEI